MEGIPIEDWIKLPPTKPIISASNVHHSSHTHKEDIHTEPHRSANIVNHDPDNTLITNAADDPSHNHDASLALNHQFDLRLLQSILKQYTHITQKVTPANNTNTNNITREVSDNARLALTTIANQSRCKICNRDCKRPSQLKRHMLSHSDEKSCLCTEALCQKAFKRHFELIDHLRDKHGITKPFKCTFNNCSESFLSRNELTEHLHSHIQCSICGKICSCSQDLARHRISHSNERPLVCNVGHCGKAYKHARDLREHRAKKHGLLENK